MALLVLKERESFKNKRWYKRYEQLMKLLTLLTQKTLPGNVEKEINIHITKLNTIADTDRSFSKELRKFQSEIVTLLEKECNWVTENHYQKKYMALGISLGVSLGTAFAIAIDNMAFLSIGLPFGLAIGIAIGSKQDKKAKEEGRQLPVTLV